MAKLEEKIGYLRKVFKEHPEFLDLVYDKAKKLNDPDQKDTVLSWTELQEQVLKRNAPR